MNKFKKILFAISLFITLQTNVYAKENDSIDMMIYMKEDIHTIARDEADGDPNKYIELLQSEAEKSQAGLIDFLKSTEGVEYYESYFISNLVHLKANKEVFQNIKKRDDVSSIELNEKQESSGGEITNLSGSLSEYSWNTDLMNIDKAKKLYNVDGTGVTIGFIDSKANFNHPEISNNFRGYIGNGEINEDGNYFDALGGEVKLLDHGTAVVSIAVGKEASEVGGIAPGSKWILARTFDKNNSTNDVVLRAAEWMMAPGGDPSRRPDIINNSWGGKNNGEKWFEDILQSWSDLGIISVFASGNLFDKKAGPSSIENPACLEGAFSVGAIDKNKNLCEFSKRGPSPMKPSIIKPEVVAPGEEVLVATGAKIYGEFRGTSAATPHITGIFALLKELKPEANIEHLKRAVIESSEPLTSSEYPNTPNFGFGYGLPKADRALELAENMKNIDRIKGNNRFETAVKISKDYFPDGASTVYIANGINYIDSLVMSILTNNSEGPLLLADENNISDTAIREIQRLNPENIVLIGGMKTLNNSVMEKIQDNTGITPSRIDGENRYATSAKIAKKASEFIDIEEIYLVNGDEEKKVDAISASGPAKYKNSPVLLTSKDALPESVEKTIEDLKIKKITIVGGNNSISKDLENDLINKGYEVDRKEGSNRYHTSVLINMDLYENPQTIFLANGNSSVDALTAGPVAGAYKYPVLIVSKDSIPNVSRDYIDSMKLENIIILGGTNSISKDVEYRMLFN